MQKNITRRALAGMVAGITAAAQEAQQQPAATPDQELAAARAQAQRNVEQIAKVPLPMSTEPAVHFKA